jgi:uncharacterized protein (DUF302 family)
MKDIGIIDLVCAQPVRKISDQLESLLSARGQKVFSRIDQAAKANSAGLTMRPMILLMFGDPKAGALRVSRYPSIAIDLPLKALDDLLQVAAQSVNIKAL